MTNPGKVVLVDIVARPSQEEREDWRERSAAARKYIRYLYVLSVLHNFGFSNPHLAKMNPCLTCRNFSDPICDTCNESGHRIELSYADRLSNAIAAVKASWLQYPRLDNIAATYGVFLYDLQNATKTFQIRKIVWHNR
jgi:hypothetical protein